MILQIDIGYCSCSLNELFEQAKLCLFFEPKVLHVDHIASKLVRTVFAEFVKRRLLLQMADVVVHRVVPRHILPGQAAPQELDHDIAQRDKIIPTGHLATIVLVDRDEAQSAGRQLPVDKFDVPPGSFVNYRACHPVIDQMDRTRILCETHQ